MIMFDVHLPEIKPENAKCIIETCRDIHQNKVNERTKNTKMQRWDKYWIAAYNCVLEKLKG